MSEVDRLLAEARARSAGGKAPAIAPKAPGVPSYIPEQSTLGGFVESAFSSLPEMIGANPSPQATSFRAAHPVAGFVSQVLPTMAPYAGMYNLSKTAVGAAALSKGMQGVKAVGQAVGLNTVNRPVIAGAVKEMLRYAPLELGRLGAGVVVNPENTGELFADVALSTAFAGAFGAGGGWLRAGGTKAIKDGISSVLGQNMFQHPAVDLRAVRRPEAAELVGADEILAAEQQLTREVLNADPVRGYISKKAVPLIQGIKDGSENLATHINALFKFNSRATKERPLDRRKPWEGDAEDGSTLNAGELEPLVQSLGFQNATEFAENTLTARVITIGNERAAGVMGKLLESPAVRPYGDGLFAAQTDTGATVLFKRIGRADEAAEPLVGTPKTDSIIPTPISPVEEAVATAKSNLDEEFLRFQEQVGFAKKKADDFLATMPEKPDAKWNAEYDKLESAWKQADEVLQSRLAQSDVPSVTAAEAPKPAVTIPVEVKRSKLSKKNSPKVLPPSAPKGPFQAGDRWVAVLTDRPGAFVKDLEKLNATNDQLFATMRRMFQPMGQGTANAFNDADDTILKIVSPLDVARMSRQSRKTWVAETAKSLKDRGVKAAGLQDNYTLQRYADYLYDVFVPGMYKEQRNSLYARYTGLLQNRLRVVSEKVNGIMHGKEQAKAGARGVMGKNFERKMVDGGMSFREAMAQLTDEEFEVVAKALMTQTPAKDVAKLAADGVITPNALRAVERMQQLNAEYVADVVLPAVKSMGEKANFNLLEGYVIPRILPGDWRTLVKNEKGQLIYMAAGKSRGAAEKLAKAVVDEAKLQGLVYNTDKSYMKHTVEMNVDDINSIMEDVGRKLDVDETAAEVVRKAVQKVQFVGVKRTAKLPFNARTPANLRYERSGIKATDQDYTREEFIGAFESHLRKLGNFAAVHSYMERWGNEIMALRGQNQTLYDDVMRRAQQAMGVEGQITQTLNNILTPVLGTHLGSKAATKIAAATNKTMYAWQLGILNPSFALLNALSPLQSVLPHLAFVMSAPRAEANKLMHYLPLIDGGKAKGVGGFLDPMRVLGESIRQLRTADEDLIAVHTRLRNDNTIHAQIFEDHVGVDAGMPTSLREAFNQGGWAKLLYEGSTWMSRKSEDFARIVSANSGYLVGRDMLQLEGEQLYHFTKRFVETTNYMYGQSDRARLITGPVGSVFGLFKNWQMHFMGMMANYAGLGIKHNVWAPLVWQSGAAMTLGGLGATPLRHVADGIANWQSGDDDSFLWMQEHFGQTAADGAWFGPASILGVSLQASSTLPGTDVRNDLQSFGNAVAWERMKQLGTAMGEGWALSKTGENPLMNSNFTNQLLAAVAPRAVSRAASVVEGEYVNSMQTGMPSVQDPSFTAKMLHGMGMNSVEIERQQTVGKRLYREQEARKADTTYHGKELAAAIAAEDYDAVDRIYLSAMARSLDIDSVGRSASNYQRREQGDLLDRYNKADVARARAILDQQ